MEPKPSQPQQFATKDEMKSLASRLYMGGIGYSEAVKEFKKHYLIAALEDNSGNVCHTAQVLDRHRNTVSRQLDELEIDVRQIKKQPKSVRAEFNQRVG